MSKIFSIVALLIAGSSQAATLNCVADGYSHDIRSINASTQADGTLKVQTMVNDYVIPAITVKAPLERFEVIAPQQKGHAGTQGIDHIYLTKIGTYRYALETVTYCNFEYQEERCLDGEIIDTKTDNNVWCQLNN